MFLKIKILEGKRFLVQIGDDKTLDDLRKVLSEKTGIAVDELRMMWNGMELKGKDPLYEYAMEEYDIVHVFRFLPKCSCKGCV